MKKILLGTAIAGLMSASYAECGCDSTSFTGAFIGASFDVSFDQDKVSSDVIDNVGVLPEAHYAQTKKNKTAFGGSLVLGYGYQFQNNLYVAVMHESSFLSKAKVSYGDIFKHYDGAVTLTASRKVYTPSFGVAFGYVVDNWNFGLRGGMSIDKVKLERELNTDFSKYNKTVTATSPYVGAYVEYKIDSVVVFGNVDYKFGKKKDCFHANKVRDSSNKITHKRPAWKLSLGVKCNVNDLIAKIR